MSVGYSDEYDSKLFVIARWYDGAEPDVTHRFLVAKWIDKPFGEPNICEGYRLGQ
jgi:hypothetical protein